MTTPDNQQRDWSLLLTDGEDYVPVDDDHHALKSRAVGGMTDVRSLEGDKRVGYYTRYLTRAECQAYAYGYPAGLGEGIKQGRVLQSRAIASQIGLKLE